MVVNQVNELGRDTFLLLLTTQLRYQDPINPVENTEFISQLTQFSQLEEAISLGDSLDVAIQYMSSLNNYGAAGLVGKEVKVEGNVLVLNQGESSTMTYRLDTDASDVTIQIYDEDGNLARSIREGQRGSGQHSITWDGMDDEGRPLDDGLYSFQVAAVDAFGQPIFGPRFITGLVSGVRYEEGVAFLMVNGEEIPAARISEIYF